MAAGADQPQNAEQNQRHVARLGNRIGGDRLLELGLITRDQLEVALYEQKRSGRMLGTVLVDKNQLEQVLLNLLKNAAEAIGEDGTVTLRTGRDGWQARRRCWKPPRRAPNAAFPSLPRAAHQSAAR